MKILKNIKHPEQEERKEKRNIGVLSKANAKKARWPTTKHTFVHVTFWSVYCLLFSRWIVLVRGGVMERI